MTTMEGQPFSPKCWKCKRPDVARATIPYTLEAAHDGLTYHVEIPGLIVPKCGNCGTLVFDSLANSQVDDAIRRTVGILAPEEIRAGREHLGYSPQQLAVALGVGSSLLLAWENGERFQPLEVDTSMRRLFASETP